jgi:site-specific recombinase XerD
LVTIAPVPAIVAIGGASTAPVHTDADRVVSDRTRARIAEGVAANTTKAYSRQWSTFEAWCAGHGRVSLPATAETAAEYVAQLADACAAPASIEQALAAIRTAHRAAGHRGVPDTTAARLVLRAHRRQRAEAGQRTRKALPITIDALRAMVDTCDTTTLRGLRDRVVLVLGLATMGRRSELVALHLDDVTETDDGLLVLVRASKTDQDAEGIEVALPYGQHADTCPVRVVRAWRAALADRGITSGRLLRSVTRHGRAAASMSTDAVTDVVRERALIAGLPNAAQYSAHSLRAGGATSAYKAGAPVSVIAAHGRWAEGSPVVLGYVRATDRWRDNPIRGVGL